MSQHIQTHTVRSPSTVSHVLGTTMKVQGHSLVNFCSNDYLGLATHPKVVQAMVNGVLNWGVGGGASHLVSGHFEPHERLEQALAEWLGFERVLLFSSGYQANLAIFSALVGKKDVVLQDKLNHASLIDGARLSGATLIRYQHNDIDSARRQILRANRPTLLVTDGVFSMDGDIAPLKALAILANEHSAWLMVDDAHALGVMGESGRGSLAHHGMTAAELPILMGTLSKAFGTAGAFVAGSQLLIESLLQRARPYIYTTSSPPALACAALASLELIRDGAALRSKLEQNIHLFKNLCEQGALPLLPSQTAIQPLLVGDNEGALFCAKQLKDRGYWVTAIRPPTVPNGTARLRVTLSAAHTETDIRGLVKALTETHWHDH